MNSAHLPVGMALVGVTVGFLGLRYFNKAKSGRFRPWGWAGLGLLFLFEILLAFRVPWITIYFTPLCWTAYILLIDAAVCSLKGSSRLSDSPRSFFLLALVSIPLWLIFEAYNLRLTNWSYVGLPVNPLLQAIGYTWSFATIWPAIFETADFLSGLGWFRPHGEPRLALGRAAQLTLIALGAFFVSAPVLVPVPIGRYLFGAVWIGFALLLDPLNRLAGGHSILEELRQGRRATLYSFLASGFVCGVFWEFWNYWAAAKWVYIFPIMQGWKVFEMPLAGYLGFLPFALECFVMYEFLGTLRRLLRGTSIATMWHASQGGGKADATR